MGLIPVGSPGVEDVHYPGIVRPPFRALFIDESVVLVDEASNAHLGTVRREEMRFVNGRYLQLDCSR